MIARDLSKRLTKRNETADDQVYCAKLRTMQIQYSVLVVGIAKTGMVVSRVLPLYE